MYPYNEDVISVPQVYKEDDRKTEAVSSLGIIFLVVGNPSLWTVLVFRDVTSMAVNIV